MYRFGVALHVIASAAWLGAALAVLVAGPVTRKLALESWANTWLILAKIQRSVVGPAALVATVTGLALTMSLAGRHFDMSSATWLIVMQGFGLIAGIIALAFATPMANRLAQVASRSLSKNEKDANAAKVEKAFTTVTGIAAAMVVAALYFGVAKP